MDTSAVCCAVSIERLEGGRWPLPGCVTAMGDESFFVCSLLILRGLQKSEKSKTAIKGPTFPHDAWPRTRKVRGNTTHSFRSRTAFTRVVTAFCNPKCTCELLAQHGHSTHNRIG